MPETHFYPKPSDPCPIFMFGQFDLDNADLGSALALGEALLSVQRKAAPGRAPATTLRRRSSGALMSWFRAVRGR